jgi:hypothetical protein
LTAGIIPIAAVLTGLAFGETTISLAVIGGALLVGAGVALGLAPDRARPAVPVPLEATAA